MLAETYKTAFWMRKHLAMTWKRTWVWSTSPRIASLDLGAMTPEERVTSVRTTKRWRTRDGDIKWQGTAELKATQQLDVNFNININILASGKKASLVLQPAQAVHLQVCWERCPPDPRLLC